MKVVFDHQAFAMQRFGGISRHFTELAVGLAARPDLSVRVVAPIFDNAYLRAAPRMGPNGVRRGLNWQGAPHPVKFGSARAWRGVERLRAALRGPADIVAETYYSNRAYGVGRVRIVTIHDMIPEIFAGRHQFASADAPTLIDIKRRSLARADHVICVSHTTRRDLLERTDLDEARVSVVPLGVRVPPAAEDAAPAAGGAAAGADAVPADAQPSTPRLPRPFLLYVGVREGYKNFAALCEAYAHSPRLCADFDLVAFGGGPATSAEHARLEALGIAGQVHFIGGGDEVMAQFYRQAHLFVYPSLYEGFGIPPLEAMAHGCAVVCSRAGSIPEVAGDAAEYFDPSQPDAIAAALERVAWDEALLADLARRGRERAKTFSWQRTVLETEALYRQVLRD